MKNVMVDAQATRENVAVALIASYGVQFNPLTGQSHCLSMTTALRMAGTVLEIEGVGK